MSTKTKSTTTTGRKKKTTDAVTASEIVENEIPDDLEDLNAQADAYVPERNRENNPESWVTLEGFIYTDGPMKNRDGSENTTYPKYMLNGGLYKMSSGAVRPGAVRIEFFCPSMHEYDQLLKKMPEFTNTPIEVLVYKNVSDDGRWTNFKVKKIRHIDSVGRTVDGTLVGETNIMGARSRPTQQQADEAPSMDSIFG